MASFLLLLLLLPLLSTPTLIRAAESSSSSSRILRSASPPAAPRIAFHPRRRGDVVVASSSSSSSSSASTSLLARRRTSPALTTPATDDVVRVVVRKTKKRGGGFGYDGAIDTKTTTTKTTGTESTRPPTPEEIRDALGPIGLLASNAIELVVVTAGSYVSGGMLGYVLGGMMGAPSALFGKSATGGMLRRLSELHARAFVSCGSWATLSASFSGFNGLVRLCRGEADDGWNAVFGSALAGAFLNRSGVKKNGDPA
ncbi:hypothetical protein ACHAW5_003532 [Stephanodiscus triporus]|uniref:Mitochondrial import inner membrane translocase subunit TIM22 n=1 Tax=Stephanodiscus triporus TaxID=2934178 RepID=A0ABD3PJ81_9STRA